MEIKMENKFEETKYGALRIVATINKILGWLIIIGGASTAFYRFNYSNDEIMALAIFATSLLVGLLSIAAGEIFYVFMDIEQNTRYIELIKKINEKIESSTLPIKSNPASENSAPLYQSSNLADVIRFLEAKGCSVIKVPKNPFMTDGKDFKVLKDGKWQEYYTEELIAFANTLL